MLTTVAACATCQKLTPHATIFVAKAVGAVVACVPCAKAGLK